MVCIKLPQSDTNKVGDYGGGLVRIKKTAKRHKRGRPIRSDRNFRAHAQAERTKKQKREEKAACKGGSDKDPEPEDSASLQVHQARAPLADDLSAQGSGLRARSELH